MTVNPDYPSFIPVPDGMDPEDAARILDNYRKWVALPDGPRREHIGKRARLVTVSALGAVIEDRVVGIRDTGEVTFAACGNNWYGSSGDWFIYRDDVRDADADLVEAIADALRDYYERDASDWPGYARTALRVVREQEGQR